MIMVTVNLGMHEKDHGHDLLVTHHRLHVPQEETEAQGVKQVTWAAQLYNADSPPTRAASVLLPGSTPPSTLPRGPCKSPTKAIQQGHQRSV